LEQISATIISNQELTEGNTKIPKVNLICVEAHKIAIAAKPGQFVMVNCGTEVVLRRPLSIHQTTASSNRVYFLFKVVGKGTFWLSKRQKGEKLDLLGPLGNGFTVKPKSRKLLLIAGGIGISPIAFLAQQAINQGKQPTLLLGAQKKEEVYKQNLPTNGLETIILTEDGSDGIKGKVSDFHSLTDYIRQADQIFGCGPLPMYRAIADLTLKMSLDKDIQVSLETRMGCGIGICYGCSIKTKHGMKMVCHDGPVFNMEEIIWQEIKL
jgi:dihydroorotate dehydrogenase electron transfer subunit